MAELLSFVFTFTLIAALVGIIKPYIKNTNRWHFVALAFVSFVTVGMTAEPAQVDEIAKVPEPEDVIEEAKNVTKRTPKSQAATLKREIAPLPPKNTPPKKITSKPSDGNPFNDVSKQRLWIIKSKEGIKKRLRDPESAQFKNVRFYSGGPLNVVCGEVNAKNGLGGYSGFERFMASGDNEDLASLASDATDSRKMDVAWNNLCVKAPRDKANIP